jgi:2OG-Fe(II) oxygenase superfamily
MSIPQERKNLITDAENLLLINFLEKIARPSPVQPNHKCALGYEHYSEAVKINKDNPAMPLTGNKDDDDAIMLVTDIFDRARIIIEDFCGKELALLHAVYTGISIGEGMGMHCDNSYLDGSPKLDGNSEKLEYSGVLYLNTSGVDFDGGELYFPIQDYRYVPTKNSLAYFIGDLDHIHEVEPVSRGERKSISLFYGFKDNI